MTSPASRQPSAHALQPGRVSFALKVQVCEHCDRPSGGLSHGSVPKVPVPFPNFWPGLQRAGRLFQGRPCAERRASRRFAFIQGQIAVYQPVINNSVRGRATCEFQPFSFPLPPPCRLPAASIPRATALSVALSPVRSSPMSRTMMSRPARSSAVLPVRRAAPCRVRSTADRLAPPRAASSTHRGPFRPRAGVVLFRFQGGLRCSTRS
jgi:hypothetical protein